MRCAQRLETTGRIAGQVAHDLNNLLSPLVTYTELIKMCLPQDHPAFQYCDTMLDIAREMADINSNLMALGRRVQFEARPVDLNQVVNQAIEQMAGRYDDVVIGCDLGPNIPPVKGSTSQLCRVIINLISNGREAMEGTGVLTIGTNRVRLDQPLGGYNRIEAGEYVKLSVSDTGCGMPAEIRDRIFDAFFGTKTSNERRGMGLGLSIVQAIVEDHRGYIDLESQVGKGTTFNVYLPVYEASYEKGHPALPLKNPGGV